MHEAILAHCKRLEAMRPDLPRLEVFARVNFLHDRPFVIQIEYRPSMDATWDQAIRRDFVTFDDAEAWLLSQGNPDQLARDAFIKDLAHLLERPRDLHMLRTADLAATWAPLQEWGGSDASFSKPPLRPFRHRLTELGKLLETAILPLCRAVLRQGVGASLWPEGFAEVA